MTSSDPILTIIMVSYNTRDLTIAAIRTCLNTTRETAFKLVVFDNASSDGSANAIAEYFPPESYPQVELIRSDENLGFAKANNVVAEPLRTEYLLLLNPDTECHEGAVDNLIAFARQTPHAGIWGGRTVFPDGALNPWSCWMRITPWSMLCWALGLTGAFPNSPVFNPEALGGWHRDSVRRVDVVSGCFFLIRSDLWHQLKGFDLDYFMYGEEADLCLRAEAFGVAPMVTPEAEIMHVAGASSSMKSSKRCMVLKARMTLIRRQWAARQIALGVALMWTGGAGRRLVSGLAGALLGGTWRQRAEVQRQIWRDRADWLSGY